MKPIPIRHIHQTQTEPSLSGSFGIRDIRELLGQKDMVEELHRHDFFYMLVLKKGAGNHEIDFKTYEISDNTVFLMRPGQVHQLTLKAGSEGCLVQFKADFFYSQDQLSQALLRKVSHQEIYILENNGFKKLDTILRYILKEFTEKQEGYEAVIKSNLNIFFIELVRHSQNKEIATTAGNLYAQEKLEKFLGLLETHITAHKQVSYYAGLLHLSAYQLNAITKTSLNKTPSELINDGIILESKRLLLATSNQVSQIAHHLGYEDVSYFIRFFKKHTGFSPEAFRHNFR